MEDRIGRTNHPNVAYFLGTFPSLTETFVVRELEGLRARGFRVSVFAVKRPEHTDIARSLCSPALLKSCTYARPDRLLAHLIENLRAILFHPRRYLSALWAFLEVTPDVEPRELARLLYHFYCGIGFAAVIRRGSISHVHCHFATGSDMALAASLYAEIPFSFSAHASGDIYMRAPLLNRKIQAARFVVAVCEYNRRYLDAVTFYRHSATIRRVYNGIDITEPTRLLGGEVRPKGTQGARSDEFTILSVGSLVARKGHATLVEVCGELQNRGLQVRCEIIGDGVLSSVLRHKIEKLGLQNRVILRGALSLRDVYAALARSDAFVLLCEIGLEGHRDGFPTVILEAMSLSLPVVATWVSGIPEMVVDGETGLLVPERDVVGAADAIERLIRDPDLCARFGRAGRARVAELFSSEASVDRLAEAFTTGRWRGVEEEPSARKGSELAAR